MLREKELALLENLKTDNEKKTEEIRHLRNNQLVGQASGEEIVTITDGALAFANILEETEIEVEGEKKKAYLVGLPQGLSRQEQREGYNMLPNLTNIENTNISGINYSIINNEIIAKGTATSGINKRIATTKITLKANTAYTFVLFTKGTAKAPLGNQAILFGTDSISNKISVPFNSDSNSLKKFTPTEDYTFDRISLYIGGSPTSSGIYIDVKIKIMILEGTYTTENLPAYEQYRETPSIEIPSEIENVKAWNLIDVEQIAQQTQNVITTFDKKNGWLTIENSNSNMAYVNILVPVEHIIIGKTYSLKVEFKSEEGCNVYLQKSAEDYSNFTQGIDDIIKNTAIDTYMKVLITPIANQTVTVRLSLAEEQEKIENKTYAPYGAISIGLGNKNLFDKNNYISLNSYFNNTGNPNISSLVTTKSIFLECKENTEYTISRKTGKRFYVGYINDYPANGILVNNVLGTDTKEVNEYTLTTGLGAKYLAIYLYNSQYDTNITFEEMINSLQVEERDTATPYTEHQEQNYNLHIGDLELNGINDIRDSFVVKLDNSYSYKKVKKLYLKKKYNEIIFDIETINNTGFAQAYTNIEKNIYQYRTIQNFIADLLVNPDPFNIKDIALCNYKKKNGPNDNINSVLNDNLFTVSGNKEIVINSNKATYADFKNELIELNNNGNPLKILYPLETPELIDVTDNVELVKDVEYLINNFKTFKEVTHVEVENGYIDLEYVKSTELAFKNMQQQIDNIQAVMLEGGTNNA